MGTSREKAKPVKVRWRTSYKEGRNYIEDQVIKQENGCWEWPGGTSQRYPLTSVGNKSIRLNRFAWETYKGKIPEGMNVLHTCDNPRCINPEHLWLGTQQENIHDMLEKGRGQKGLRCPKLTPADVVAMKERFNAGGCTYRGLAREYGVDVRWMRGIMQGEKWKGVGEDTREKAVEVSKGNKKMTNKKAKEIRVLLKKGVSIEELQERYGVSQTTVYEAKKGRVWQE